MSLTVGARSELKLTPSYDAFINREVTQSNIFVLNLTLDHFRINASLPFHHRDPFDRIIIAQSMAENLPIITVDSVFHQYPIMII